MAAIVIQTIQVLQEPSSLLPLVCSARHHAKDWEKHAKNNGIRKQLG